MLAPATLADLGDAAMLFDLYRKFYRKSSDLPQEVAFLRERITRHESVIFVARDDHGAAIGFAQMYPSFSSLSLSKVFILYDLFVHPEARQCGVGKQLLAACVVHAKSAGAGSLNLSTAVDNFVAQALYESAGWQRDDAFYVYEFMIT